jgi:uncharacterized protein YbjT (DUF2867 family)
VPRDRHNHPSGQIGRQVLGHLLESGQELRVITRDPSQLPTRVREDLDIVEGSHGDAAVADKAFAGADAILWVTPADPRAPSVEAAFAGFTRPAAEAFHRHGVGRVVGVSMLGHGTPWAAQAGFVTGSLAMDDLIAASGVAYRALANPYFMEDTTRQADSIKNQGLFSWPIAGDRKRPTVATRDIAAVASRLLLDASWSGVEEVPLLGPEDLSYNDMAEIMSQVLGKDVRYQRITFEAYKDRFIRLGVSDAMAQAYTDMAWAKNEGLDNGVQRTPQNSTPTSFRQWCEEVLKPAVAS